MNIDPWHRCCPSWKCLMLFYLNWQFDGFELLTLLFFLAAWLVMRICCEVARTSSSSIAYLSTLLNKSSIVASGFLVRDSKNKVSRLILFLKFCRSVFMLYNSTCNIACPNHFMKSLSDYPSYILMFCKVLIFCFYRA